MSTKDIRTSYAHTICDVCGRTLLRGEQAETYINAGARRSVCELCKTRALHEGWVREGTLPAYGEHESGADRRRSLLGRLRSRREAGGRSPSLDDELSGGIHLHPPVPAPSAGAGARPRPAPVREPRHVRAVPVGEEHKVISAVDTFNRSEHPRTVAGVARSLGAPVVCVNPDDERPSLVDIIVSWELCWYRYEVDLSDEAAGVRVDGQGYELSELADEERMPNATADDVGHLYVA